MSCAVFKFDVYSDCTTSSRQDCMDNMAGLNSLHFWQDAPPLTRNMPPVAGSIKWSRSLFARVKQTMQKLQDVEAELLQGETGQEVNQLCQPFNQTQLRVIIIAYYASCYREHDICFW